MKDIDRKWDAKRKAVDLLTEIDPESDTVDFYAEGHQMIKVYEEIENMLRLKAPEEVFWILASAIEEKSRSNVAAVDETHPNALITGHFAVLADAARLMGFDEGYKCAREIYEKKLEKLERKAKRRT